MEDGKIALVMLAKLALALALADKAGDFLLRAITVASRARGNDEQQEFHDRANMLRGTPESPSDADKWIVGGRHDYSTSVRCMIVSRARWSRIASTDCVSAGARGHVDCGQQLFR